MLSVRHRSLKPVPRPKTGPRPARDWPETGPRPAQDRPKTTRSLGKVPTARHWIGLWAICCGRCFQDVLVRAVLSALGIDLPGIVMAACHN
jgi:hypothetical protein